MNDKRHLFRILVNFKLSWKICKYLDLSDLNSLSLVSHSVNTLLKTNNIKERLCMKDSIDFIYLYNNEFEIVNEEKIKSAWEESDRLYNQFYSQSHFIIQCYYFSFLLLGIDLYSFLVAFKPMDDSSPWLTQIPFIFHWIISLVSLSLYVVRYKRLKKQMREIVKREIIQNDNLYKKEMLFLAKKLKLRTKNKQPMAFEKLSMSFIIFYVPVLIKLCAEKLGSSYKKAFWASTTLIFFYLFFESSILTIFKKCKARKVKRAEYRKLFEAGDTQFYDEKMREYLSSEVRSRCGESCSTLVFLIAKFVLFLIVSFYLDNLGAKFDGEEDSYSWFALFSPVYIAIVFILAWGILFSYSIRHYPLYFKWRFNVTVIIISLSICSNGILIPMQLEKIIRFSEYYPFGIFCLATVAIFYHFYLIKKYNKFKKKSITKNEL